MQNDAAKPSPPKPTARNLHWILGLPFDAVTLLDAVDRVRAAAINRTPLFISTANLNFLIATQKDDAFRDSVIQSDLNLADGMPIVWLARLMGLPIKERVAGASLFEALRYQPLRANELRLKVYFFGGPDGVAQEACEAVNKDSTSMYCVGFSSPGFGSIEDMSKEAVFAHINASQADFVIVSLGAAKGQAWIMRNRAQLNAPVISHLGAVVNLAAGRINRAPMWVQKMGMEWAWRIKEEPKLAKRYLKDGIEFIILLINHKQKL